MTACSVSSLECKYQYRPSETCRHLLYVCDRVRDVCLNTECANLVFIHYSSLDNL